MQRQKKDLSLTKLYCDYSSDEPHVRERVEFTIMPFEFTSSSSICTGFIITKGHREVASFTALCLTRQPGGRIETYICNLHRNDPRSVCTYCSFRYFMRLHLERGKESKWFLFFLFIFRLFSCSKFKEITISSLLWCDPDACRIHWRKFT